jgi:ubiquinone biosynthesis protein Coq4
VLVKRDFQEFDKLIRVYLPHILQQASRNTFFLNIYFERHFETDIDEMRASLGIRPLKL